MNLHTHACGHNFEPSAPFCLLIVYPSHYITNTLTVCKVSYIVKELAKLATVRKAKHGSNIWEEPLGSRF